MTMKPPRRDLKLFVSATNEAITVTWRGAGVGPKVFEHPDGTTTTTLARGVAEASCVGGTWWVNRVLVQPPGVRNNGVGGHMLDQLNETVISRGGTHLLVSPGAYEGRIVDQERFYEAHGFKMVERGLYRWTPP